MTLTEARDNIGRKVIYKPGIELPEYGVITSVNDKFVFVRYGSQASALATRAEDLTLLSGGTP